MTEPSREPDLVSEMLVERPGDAAARLKELSDKERSDLIQQVPRSRAADLLDELPDDLAAATIRQLTPEQAAPIVQEMQTDEEVDLLQALPDEVAESILTLVKRDDAAVARQLLSYDENTAGGLMQAEFIVLPGEMTARQVVTHLRDQAIRYADYPATYLYVTQDGGRLAGVVSMRELVLCKGTTRLKDIMSGDVLSVPTGLDAEELLKLFHRSHFLAIPVVDEQERMVGIVTQSDALELAEEDADEEMLKFTGIAGGDELRSMPLWHRSRRRLLWLSLNVLLNVLAASVISYYEETLHAVISLAMFLPIISDLSGCSGNQAVAVSIRELSLERIRPRNLIWVLRKETFVGLFNGLALGGLIAAIAWLWKGDVTLGIVLGIALWTNTFVAVLFGGTIPLLLKRFGWDPALASSPILTTLTDSTGFFLTLTLATRWLDVL